VCQTLFYIPREIGGIPVFGAGWLLAAWALFGLGLLAWLAWQQGLGAETLGYVPLLLVIGAVIAWLLPGLCEPEGLPIRGYGMMLLLAVTAGTGLAVWRARRIGIDPDLVVSLAFWLFLPGIVGARLFYVIEYWPSFHRPDIGQTLKAILSINQGGLVVYGSLLGGAVGLVLFVRRNALPLLPLGDLVAPSVLLGLALGRIGCLLNGCCYGGPCELPWSVRFPWGSPAHLHQVHDCKVYLHGLKLGGGPSDPAVIAAVEPASAADKAGLKPGQTIIEVNGQPVHTAADAQKELLASHEPGMVLSIRAELDAPPRQWILERPTPRSLPVHPTQIYSAINALLLCLLLLAYDPFRRRDGELFALAITLYPISRFLLEIIRTDESPVFGTGLSISQNVSLMVLAAAAALWVYIVRQPPRAAPAQA